MAFNYKTEYQKYRSYYLDLKRVYQTRREVKAYVEIAFAILSLSFFTIFAIKPTLVTIASLQSEIRSQNEIDSKLSQKVESLRVAYGNYKRLEERLGVLDLAGTNLPRITAFLRQAEALANRRGITISSFSVGTIPIGGEISTGEPFLESKFSMGAKGSYEGVLGFIQDLENLKRIVTINSYSVTEDQLDGANINISFQGGVLYLPQKSQPVRQVESEEEEL